MKTNIWEISGYKGWSDYDGSSDNNFSFKVTIDSRFTKEEVEYSSTDTARNIEL